MMPNQETELGNILNWRI